MGKWWSLLFGATMLGCAAFTAAAPFYGWWLPEGLSTHAVDVDQLFYVILGVTTFFFFLTEFLLCYFMFVYAGRPTPEVTNQGRPPAFMRLMAGITKLIPPFLHDQHRVEMAWTVVPAIILLYIAFAQVDTWAQIKYKSRGPNATAPDAPLQVGVSARQFEWRMRYPDPVRARKWFGLAYKSGRLVKDVDEKNKQADDVPLTAREKQDDIAGFAREPRTDDVNAVNEFHAWKGHPVVAHVTTRDVIHSFNLPNFRVKQDALPGRATPAWFTALKANTARKGDRWIDSLNPDTQQPDPAYTWDIPCAELCGWGHFRMIGRVYIHDSQADFLAWLDQAARDENKGRDTTK